MKSSMPATACSHRLRRRNAWWKTTVATPANSGANALGIAGSQLLRPQIAAACSATSRKVPQLARDSVHSASLSAPIRRIPVRSGDLLLLTAIQKCASATAHQAAGTGSENGLRPGSHVSRKKLPIMSAKPPK